MKAARFALLLALVAAAVGTGPASADQSAATTSSVGEPSAAEQASRLRGPAGRRTVQAYLYDAKSQEGTVGKDPAPGETYVPSEVECVAHDGTRRNLILDCDTKYWPKNEPDIEVATGDDGNVVASSNDYESCCDQFYTTRNGGLSWVNGDMSIEDKHRIGSDPVSVFDPRTQTWIHSSLNFICGEFQCRDGDLVVSLSTNEGITWGPPVVVAEGVGADFDPLQVFHDKEWIVTDTNPRSPYYGRTYLTWTAFIGENGNYVESPIMESHSDDGGRTWTAPREISGSSPRFCTFQSTGPPGECDEDQFSVPTVGPGGDVYVAFMNGQNEAAWERRELFEDQYMVVRSSDGGRTWSRPFHVANLENGTRDYPVNVDGRQTLTGFQVRVNGAGNIVAHPETGKLFLVFSDNRHGKHDVRNPVTNTDVFITTSPNGSDWTRPQAVTLKATDQWFPWVEVDPKSGRVGVLYHDRRGFALYDTTLAEARPRALERFSYLRVNTRSSHPRNSQFFQARVPGCRECATFHGDYIGLDYDSRGRAHVAWTDMRRYLDTGYGMNIVWAEIPNG